MDACLQALWGAGRLQVRSSWRAYISVQGLFLAATPHGISRVDSEARLCLSGRDYYGNSGMTQGPGPCQAPAEGVALQPSWPCGGENRVGGPLPGLCHVLERTSWKSKEARKGFAVPGIHECVEGLRGSGRLESLIRGLLDGWTGNATVAGASLLFPHLHQELQPRENPATWIHDIHGLSWSSISLVPRVLLMDPSQMTISALRICFPAIGQNPLACKKRLDSPRTRPLSTDSSQHLQAEMGCA